MRSTCIVFILLSFFSNLLLGGCALGRKEWPVPKKNEDRFSLQILDGVRQGDCLLLEIAVRGAVDRIRRVAIQYEAVGPEEGQGCAGCPFVPRRVREYTRNSREFNLQGTILKLGLCGLEPGIEYRFRVVGTSELPAMPLESTDVYQSLP